MTNKAMAVALICLSVLIAIALVSAYDYGYKKGLDETGSCYEAEEICRRNMDDPIREEIWFFCPFTQRSGEVGGTFILHNFIPGFSYPKTFCVIFETAGK